MKKVDRANFAESDNPYLERAIPIGYNATISSPHMVFVILYTIPDIISMD
jgi:protein-L-isoaspartate O-methyltransferase